MVNERKCETVQEEECSMVSLKIFLKIFSLNGEFDNFLLSVLSFTKYFCSMVSLTINFSDLKQCF